MRSEELLGWLVVGAVIGGVATCMQTGSVLPMVAVVVAVCVLFKLAGYGPRK
jgi:hypothetical protein